MRLGLGLSICNVRGQSTPAPALTSLNHDLADSAGGDSITITGTNLGSATACTVGGTSATITGNTSTTLTFTMPAKAAGSYNVQVTTAGGASGTLSIEAWAPTDDANCTLLFDPVSSPYNAATGVWTPRYSVVASATLDNYDASHKHAASGGGVVLDGDATSEAGMKNAAARTWAEYLSAASGGERAGTIAAVFSSTNTDTLDVGTAGVGGSPYNNPSAIGCMANGSGELGIGFGNVGATPSVYATMLPRTPASYLTRSVAATANALHAVVARWTLGAAGSFDLSVDGALSGAGYATLATAAGADDTYLGFPITLGDKYPAGTASVQTFAGTQKAFAILKAAAADSFITKFYKWSQVRLGVT